MINMELNSIDEVMHLINEDRENIFLIYSTWCPSCRILRSKLIDYQKMNQVASIYEINIDKIEDVNDFMKIKHVPSVVITKKGMILNKVEKDICLENIFPTI